MKDTPHVHVFEPVRRWFQFRGAECTICGKKATPDDLVAYLNKFERVCQMLNEKLDAAKVTDEEKQ